MPLTKEKLYIRKLSDLNIDDLAEVGGKNASLGEMIQKLKAKGIRVPGGFATTAKAYWDHLEHNGLKKKIKTELDAYENNKSNLKKTGKKIRSMILKSEFSDELKDKIKLAYQELCEASNQKDISVAVRSSATAEDLPEASFAGQLDSFLNISGEKELLKACKKCIASLFTNRAIAYREDRGFDHMQVALSVGVQKMVASDKASAGVMFSIHTETAFADVVVINSAWGLGEGVVQGSITPDEFIVFKPFIDDEKLNPIIGKEKGQKEEKIVYAKSKNLSTKKLKTTKKERNTWSLTDKEIIQLASWAKIIEKHYGKAMDMEWGKDGNTEELFILQARPETVRSQEDTKSFNSYTLKDKGQELCRGLAIGKSIVSAKACVIEKASNINQFKEGSILVTHMTDPDWGPILKKAKAVVTDQGGRTSHAAIVSRELGIPAVIGCGDATKKIKNKQELTVSCAEGPTGKIYKGILDFSSREIKLDKIPKTKTELMLNMASPDGAFQWARLPSKGIGLARMEFIINNKIKIHPMALVKYPKLKDKEAIKKIKELTHDYQNKEEYFIDKLAQDIAKIAASQYPHDVIVRFSDFKSNEYAGLLGGKEFEPDEENPMLGFRGASRYYSEDYEEGFALECAAVKKAREEMGFKNIIGMIPFCRTVDEAKLVLKTLEKNKLKRGVRDFKIYMMVELPSNVFLAINFAELFDGFSIGSNDLTQLILGVDRDSEKLKELFDEENQAVKDAISLVIKAARKAKIKVGICGQAPSDHPDFAKFLVDEKIDSISLNPDTFVETISGIAKYEKISNK